MSPFLWIEEIGDRFSTAFWKAAASGRGFWWKTKKLHHNRLRLIQQCWNQTARLGLQVISLYNFGSTREGI
jgi:hypothetical protein